MAKPRDSLLPDWRGLIRRSPDRWSSAVRRANGPRVLVANSIPSFHNSTNLESTLAAALTLRGARVEILVCDELLPTCMNVKFRKVAPGPVADGSFREHVCGLCVKRGRTFEDLQLPVHAYGDFVSADAVETIRRRVAALDVAELRQTRYRGLAVGEHAYAGCLRYYSTGDLEGQPLADEVLRRNCEAAFATADATLGLTAARDYDAVLLHHGIYIPQGVVAEACRSRGIAVTTWNPAYRARSFIFSHRDSYHHTLMDEPVEEWKDMWFTDAHEAEIAGYLRSRWYGTEDWIFFHDTPDDRLDTLVAETGLDPQKPTIGMLTNVMWDAQLHYPANVFPEMLTWIRRTVAYFGTRPDLQLLIRVHPAELRGMQRSRQLVVDEIDKAFAELPANVFVIPPQSNVNTYTAMERCNSVLIYGTKTGVELTSMGIPVIVAGEAWIRNKGLTLDARSEDHYFQMLDEFPMDNAWNTPERIREARKYAYHYFMRRMIPLDIIRLTPDSKVPFEIGIESLEDLLPGRDQGLDIICRGILEGTPYVYPAEHQPPHAPAAAS